MRTIYIDMVADLFHWGHVEVLRRAREMGDRLLVGIHSDEAVASYKRQPVCTMEERARVVAACRYVDEVIRDAPLVVTERYMRIHEIDLVVRGGTNDPLNQRFNEDPIRMGRFRAIPYTPNISTSDVIARIGARNLKLSAPD